MSFGLSQLVVIGTMEDAATVDARNLRIAAINTVIITITITIMVTTLIVSSKSIRSHPQGPEDPLDLKRWILIWGWKSLRFQRTPELYRHPGVHVLLSLRPATFASNAVLDAIAIIIVIIIATSAAMLCKRIAQHTTDPLSHSAHAAFRASKPKICEFIMVYKADDLGLAGFRVFGCLGIIG